MSSIIFYLFSLTFNMPCVSLESDFDYLSRNNTTYTPNIKVKHYLK